MRFTKLPIGEFDVKVTGDHNRITGIRVTHIKTGIKRELHKNELTVVDRDTLINSIADEINNKD